MSFDEAAIDALVEATKSVALSLGIFQSVNFHEPKGAPPGNYIRCAIWASDIEPIPEASGLASTTGLVLMTARLFGNMLQKPEDSIDPKLMVAAVRLIGAFSMDFTLGGTIRNIDLQGGHGPKMGAHAGYVTIDSKMFRIFDVKVPCIIDDMWTQAA